MLAFVRHLGVVAAIALGGFAEAQEAAQTNEAGEAIATGASLDDLRKAEAEAGERLKALTPIGARLVNFGDELTVSVVAGGSRPASAELQAAFDVLKQATLARNALEKKEAPAADEAELAAAMQEIKNRIPAGAEIIETRNGMRLNLASGEIELLDDDLWLLVQRKEEVERRIADRAAGVPTEETPQLRIVADAGAAGQTGSFNRNGMVLTQALVFNRAAVLTETLSAERRGYGAYDIPAGALLFVVDGANGASDPAYCLPRHGKFSFFSRAMPAWIPCYFDWDRDGALEIQTYGGEPVNGIYMHARDFGKTGTVTRPARFKSIPSMDGYKQFIGVRLSQETHDKMSGVRKIGLELMVGADPDGMQPILGTKQLETLTGAEIKVVAYRGARIEVQASAANKLTYKVIEAMPDQMLEIGVFRTWRAY